MNILNISWPKLKMALVLKAENGEGDKNCLVAYH